MNTKEYSVYGDRAEGEKERSWCYGRDASGEGAKGREVNAGDDVPDEFVCEKWRWGR